MVRLIKRYGSRKLYDTEESRYVSLDELAAWIREGQHVKVVDNDTSEDVTPQTLTQVILDQGKRGAAPLPPSELLHEIIRQGRSLVATGVEQVQHGVGRVLKASLERLGPVRAAREEAETLRRRLEELEASLGRLERREREREQEHDRPRKQPAVKATAPGDVAALPEADRD